jgi:hypothetical protein
MLANELLLVFFLDFMTTSGGKSRGGGGSARPGATGARKIAGG